MPAPLNLVGTPPFGRLTVIRLSSRREPASGAKGRARGWTLPLWECRCACGNPEPVYVTTAKLRSGNTRSCGCLQRDGARASPAMGPKRIHPKHCVGCGVAFLGSSRQRYHSRTCKEACQLADWPGRHCAACGTLLDDMPRCGRREDYCSATCKRHAAAVRNLTTEAASLAAELQERLSRGQDTDVSTDHSTN